MENQVLINNLKAFNAISPNQEWADLARMNLLHQMNAEPAKQGFSFEAFSTFALSMRWAAAGALVFVMMMGGMVVAAQNSLPGSPLYAVKIASENVQGVIPFGEKEEARSAAIARRRVEEASKLASAKLSDEEAVSVQTQLQEYNALIEAAANTDNPEEAKEKAQEVEAKAVALGSVLGSAENGEGFSAGLKAAVEARLGDCANEEVKAMAQASLEAGTTEGLVEANELSLRCNEAGTEDEEPAVEEEDTEEVPVQEPVGEEGTQQ